MRGISNKQQLKAGKQREKSVTKSKRERERLYIYIIIERERVSNVVMLQNRHLGLHEIPL